MFNQLSNVRSLHSIMQRPIRQFAELGSSYDTEDGLLVHIDNGADILAVGHLDYVRFDNARFCDGKVYGGQLDDRLGVWGLLNGLPQLTSVPYDILLTDAEEVGCSTAQHFDPPREYRWGFELDRAGTDCVLYQYDDDTLADELLYLGWSIGSGSFSDISYLSHCECQFANFGIGYHEQHTKHCFAYLDDVTGQLHRVADTLDQLADQSFPYTEAVQTIDTSWQDADVAVCQLCGESVWRQWNYCPDCGDALWRRVAVDY